MDRTRFEEQFVEFLLGRLPEEKESELCRALETDAQLREDFEEYRKIFEVTQRLKSKEYSVDPRFSLNVMDKVLASPQKRRSTVMDTVVKTGRYLRPYVGPAALTATACTALLVSAVTFLGTQASSSFSMVSSSISTTTPFSMPVAHEPPSGAKIESARMRENELKKQEIVQSGITSELSDDRKDIRIFPSISPATPPQSVNAQPATGLIVAQSRRGVRPLSVAKWKVGETAEGSSPSFMRSAADAEDRAVDASSLGATEQDKLEPFAKARKEMPARGGVGETYGQFEENPRVLAATQPVSTFSIDVDTGSYTNSRRFLQLGQFPPSDAVRIEEYLNYFDYDYPSASDGKPFSVSYEMAPSPLEKDRYLLKVGIKAQSANMNDDRGWNLVFLVDVSGSMADTDKLPLLKQSMRILVEKMRPIDRLAIVTYAGEAGTLIGSTPGSEKEKLLRAIESLGAGGSTNGSGGINAAYQVAEQARRNDGVNRVILATDGDFNVGVASFDGLMELVEQKRRSGITLTTIGVGSGNYNERNLEQLADKGNGNYFYLDSIEEAQRVLSTKLASNMEVVAKDVKLQLEFNPAQVAGYRLIGYDNRKLRNQDFTNDAIDAGEIGAGHTVTALYEVIMKDSPAVNELKQDLRYRASAPEGAVSKDLSSEVAFLKIRYKKPNGDTSSQLEFPLTGENVQRDLNNTSRDFRFAAAVSYFGHILRHSQYSGTYSLSDVKELALGATGDKTDRKELVSLIEKAQQISGVGR